MVGLRNRKRDERVDQILEILDEELRKDADLKVEIREKLAELNQHTEDTQ